MMSRAENRSTSSDRRPLAHGLSRSSRAGSSWWLAGSLQNFSQHHCIVATLVLRSKEKREALVLMSEFEEAMQSILRLRLRQFLQVFLAEGCPLIGLGVVPAPEFG